MKQFLLKIILLTVLTSCASIDSIKKSSNCVVWKDQKIWGPYSIEVIEKKVEWKGSCKGYKLGCDEVLISLDENNNVLSKNELLGKIENNELQFSEKHALSDILNFTAVRVYPELFKVNLSSTTNKITLEESFQFNGKCSPEEAIVGAIGLGLISKSQNKGQK